ncbi:ATP-sensitive inward rectifier potassium channel 10-like [Ambystoma mexicanum]|uniref:ATP-sensitive inward rectifier potassium channel 10-like n=1 Tax=Ambystoma mexicanum TaxID=8296 RepID=UPI0037E8F1AF
MDSSAVATVSELVEQQQVPPPHQSRLIGRCGEINIEIRNLDQHFLQADLWSTLMDLPWHCKLLVMPMLHSASWVLFGTIWYVVTLAHGNLLKDPLTANQTSCMTNVNSFTSAFLFSLETQATIGYGVRRISEECPLAIAVHVLQIFFGMVLDTVLAAMILAEFSRPSRRSSMVRFSRKVLVTLVNGVQCLVIRVADTKKCFIINCCVSAKLFIAEPGGAGAAIDLVQKDICFLEGASTQNPLLAFPISFCHRLDEQSPLWGLSNKNVSQHRFELVVVLSGIIASTGATCQTRASYLPTDIMWGYQFLPVVTRTEKGRYRATPTALDMVTRDSTLEKEKTDI